MNNAELKEALANRRPVIAHIPLLGDIEYAYVSGIIYRRKENGTIYVSAEITDRNLWSVTIVNPKHISYKE